MTASRRTVLMAGLGAIATGLAAGTMAAKKGARTLGTETAPPPLDGEIRFDGEARAAAAEDFGHIAHRTPEGVLLPASDRDVAATIRWAAKRGRTLTPQGARHSVFGRSLVHDGIVADMTRLRNIHSIQTDRIVVGAGATWSEVVAATLPQGLTPPVPTDYLGLSVGGTLVVGGIGATTSRFGMQSDNVVDLEVVTGQGQQVVCSPEIHADLFNAVRGGLGQVGVIVRATLRLIAAPQRVRRYLLIYTDLKTMLADQRLLAADNRFDAVQGAVLPASTGWTFRLDAVKQFSGNPPDDSGLLAGLSDMRGQAQLSTLPYVDYLNRLAVLEQALRANGQWFFPHPWLTTFVGDSNIESVVRGELATLTAADLGTSGQVVLSAFRRQAITSPLLRLPADNLCHAFNLVRIPTTDNAAEANRLVMANRAAYDRIRAAGGTLYPVSAFPMSRDDWRRHFGPAFRGLSDAKAKFDPRHVLTPGYEVF